MNSTSTPGRATQTTGNKRIADKGARNIANDSVYITNSTSATRVVGSPITFKKNIIAYKITHNIANDRVFTINGTSL